MKYAVASVTNGNFAIHSEHGTNLVGAKMEWHSYSRALWNDPATTTAMVIIVDENLDVVEGYKEYISHPVPVPVEE